MTEHPPPHEDLIRQRAWQIWDAEGRPEGREAQHWDQAEREYRQGLLHDPAEALLSPGTPGSASGSGAAPKPRTRKKG